jgi:hypothetical protein
MSDYDKDGNPLVQGVVNAKIQPIVFKKNTGESGASAVGQALDKDGNPIDQTELLRLLGVAP